MTTLRDLAYAAASGAQRLDLFLPDRAPGEAGFPLVVAIHGGAFKWGDRSLELGLLDQILDAGLAVASVDYRLSGEARFPAAVDDVREAVRYLRSRSTELALDQSRFCSWGRSAGGYLAAALGLIPDRSSGFDLDSAINSSPRVAAVVDWYGPSDFLSMDPQFREAPPTNGEEVQWHDGPESPESEFLGGSLESTAGLAQMASVLTWVRQSTAMVPFFVAAGDQDALVPHQQSETLVRALAAKRAPVDFVLLADAGHASLRFDDELGGRTIDWILRSLA